MIRAVILLACILHALHVNTVAGELSEKQKTDILDMHNKLRKKLLDGELEDQPQALEMPIMEWNDELTEKAKEHTAKCEFEHDTDKDREIPGYSWVGQNMAAMGKYEDPVQMWFDEHKDYNYRTGACRNVCGHYTQVVWANSVKLGCSMKQCPNLFEGQGGYLVTCNYAPGGNYRGQKPYKANPNGHKVNEDKYAEKEEEPEKKKVVNLMTEDEKKEMLRAHNKYRQVIADGLVARFPKADEMNYLEWDEELEEKAAVYAMECKFWREPPSKRKTEHYPLYGQNYFGCPNPHSSPVYAWFQMEKHYNYEKNTSAKDTTSFRQVIWYKAKKLGCSRSKCGPFKIVICNYDSSVEDDVRPYPKCDESKINPDVGSKYCHGTKDGILRMHNELREDVKKGKVVGSPKATEMDKIIWSKTLAKIAQKLASECKSSYTAEEGKGINFASERNEVIDYFGGWKEKMKKFSYDSPCEGECLQYSQLVTAEVSKIGCGYEVCEGKLSKPHNYVCLYNAKTPTDGRPYPISKDDPFYDDNVGSELTLGQRYTILSQHNYYRTLALEGEIRRQPKAKSMPPLKWNAALAASAQKDIEPCRYQRFPNDGTIEGVGSYTNLFQFSVRDMDFLQYWFNNNWKYQYESNHCGYGCEKYKQLVSAKTSLVGCAEKRCQSNWGKVTYFKCNYAVMTYGELKNERPYEKV